MHPVHPGRVYTYFLGDGCLHGHVMYLYQTQYVFHLCHISYFQEGIVSDIAAEDLSTLFSGVHGYFPRRYRYSQIAVGCMTYTYVASY